MKKFICALAMGFVFTLTSFAQITTASSFFKSISDYYATLQDYECMADIKINKNEMRGKVSFMRPEMMRIDFIQPANQCVCFDGSRLVIYLPGQSAILEQNITPSSAKIAASPGLSLLRRYYTVAYESGQAAVPLDEYSDEKVVNLVLYRRSSNEAFRVIKLSINPTTKLIRRVVATTPRGDVYTFNFTDYKLNTKMSEQRFVYDPPSSANNYSNVLLSE